MSYSYVLYVKPEGGAVTGYQPRTDKLLPIGPFSSVIVAMGERYPDLVWEAPRDDEGAWFLRSRHCDSAEFWISADTSGNVSCVHASHIDRSDVVALAAALNLVVFDPQNGEVFCDDTVLSSPRCRTR